MVCWHHARGGEGAKDLAEAVIKACQQPTQFKFLYPLEASIKVPSSGLTLCSNLKSIMCTTKTNAQATETC